MKTYVFDPTANDPMSKVRGIGRYLQILRENFAEEFIFTNDSNSVPSEGSVINPFFNFTQPPTIKRRVAKKQIAVIHDLIPLKYPIHYPLGVRGKLNVFANKSALKNYDLIVTDSEVSKKDIVKILKVDDEKVKVIYPILPKFFSQSSGVKKTGSYAIYVGDATWNKNLVNLAKAIQEADITCVFIGKVFSETSVDHPWQKELKEFLLLTKDDKRFIFPGFVDDKQLLEYYQHARVNLLLSRDEGFGFSYVEAGSQGTGSILADRPIFREIAKSNAVFVDPENVGDIAMKIKEVYSNAKKQKDLGVKAKKRSGDFSAEKFKKAFINILS